MAPKLDRLDHLVLTVRDLAASRDFYTRVLGMEARTGPGPVALHFGDQKLHLHQAGSEFEPKAARPTPGSGDLCFTTRSPIDTVVAELREAGVEIIEGPARRVGARATLLSVYFRDPDGNLVEVSNELEDSDDG
jgi:catechol 2,3-dioxygenase-like lactoylglutathione lyase family enzyme